MALSSNWKALSSKVQPEKAGKNRISKKPKKRQPSTKNVAPIEKLIKVVTSPKTKLLTPLEFALWTSSHSGFTVDTNSRNISVDYSDKRKLAPGKFLAMDCEFVGVGADDHSELARVSIVNYYGVVLLDTYVKPNGRVTDWRTWVSGVTPQHMHSAITFKEARKKVQEIINKKVLVGHAVHNDLNCLNLTVPKHLIRDTCKEFKKQNGGKAPSLKKLCLLHLGMEIQTGQHSSVEDAQATMAIFRLHQKTIEAHSTRRDV